MQKINQIRRIHLLVFEVGEDPVFLVVSCLFLFLGKVIEVHQFVLLVVPFLLLLFNSLSSFSSSFNFAHFACWSLHSFIFSDNFLLGGHPSFYLTFCWGGR